LLVTLAKIENHVESFTQITEATQQHQYEQAKQELFTTIENAKKSGFA
jgi:hypothetical protein